MASSSVSQEDFDPEYELSTRRSRVRVARSTRGTVTASNRQQQGDDKGAGGDGGDGATSGPCLGVVGGHHADGHDTSPKPTGRVKDGKRGGGGGCGGGGVVGGGGRPNHINKGKQQRDRRKLREKRRSTGVVHLPSTESTGGSTGEDDDGLLCPSAETKKNTMLNESADKDKNANHSTEDRMPRVFRRRNKSPSDLDADDEDNQDYDSTVNQSDSTMSLKQEAMPPATTTVTTMTTVTSTGATTPTIGLGRCRATSNGRPDTPDTESLEDLLERAREENRCLLELLAEKDHKIGCLQEEISRLHRVLHTSESEKDKLREENKTLLRAVAQLRVT